MADKDKMKEISEMLEQGVHDLFTTEQYTTYLRTMDKFHEYSFNNQVLIATQRPDATLMAGYQAWQKKFNRHVKKGEKGIKITAPGSTQRTITRNKIDEQTGEVIRDANGVPQTEEVTITVPRFRTVTVFDVSQTEGEPLPERPGAEVLTAHVDNYTDMMSAIRKVSPVPVRFEEDIPGTANGYFDPQAKEIVIRSGMPEAQTVKTAIHELTHAVLHDPDKANERKDQVTREVEAESTAFIICNHFGIDTGAYTFPYIAAWSSSVEMKELRESMDLIRTTASNIIDNLIEHMELGHEAEVSYDQEPAQPGQQKYLEVELFGIPVLFSKGYIADEDVPAGLYRYDLRGSTTNPDQPKNIEKNATENHAGTLLSTVRIPYLDHTKQLALGDGLRFAGSREKTIDEFMQLWGDLKDYPNTHQVMNNNVIQANEGLVWAGHDGPRATHEDIYAIYQINRPDTPYEFMNTNFIKKHGLNISATDYTLVYGGTLSGFEKGKELDALYQRFNMDRPDNFSGHSMSVSDVVILNRGNEVQAYYVDSVGYAPLPGFIVERAADLNRSEISQDIACRRAIESAIKTHFDGTYLDKNSADAVIEEFGVDRVQHVLAFTVCQKDYDGRFSPDTKAWAHEVTKGKADDRPDDSWSKVVVDSHPAVLDGFIGQVRKYAESSRDMDRVKDVESFAERLDNFAKAYDHYEYMDTVDDLEQHIQNTKEHIQNGDTAGIQAWLQDVADSSDSPNDVATAKALAKELNTITEGPQNTIGNIVYAPAYDNGQWKVTEIDLTQARWIGNIMEYHGKAYGKDREMYTTEEAAWKYINNDPTAYRELVRFDDNYEPFLSTNKEKGTPTQDRELDAMPEKVSVLAKLRKNQAKIRTQGHDPFQEERGELCR